LNNRIGDCVIAGALHECILWNAEAEKHPPIGDEAALNNYIAVTGYVPGPELTCPLNEVDQQPKNPTDTGADPGTLAEYRLTKGLTDDQGGVHKIGAYVALQPGNWTELWYATYYFDGVGLGFQLPKIWMDDFPQPWDHVDNPKIDGGHYVTSVGWSDDDHALLVSWGRTVELTKAGYTQPGLSDETYAYASDEKLLHGEDMDGLNWSQLRHDIELLKAGLST